MDVRYAAGHNPLDVTERAVDGADLVTMTDEGLHSPSCRCVTFVLHNDLGRSTPLTAKDEFRKAFSQPGSKVTLPVDFRKDA